MKSKEALFCSSGTADVPWMVIKSANKKRAHINYRLHFLDSLPYPNKAKKMHACLTCNLFFTTKIIHHDDHIVGAGLG